MSATCCRFLKTDDYFADGGRLIGIWFRSRLAVWEAFMYCPFGMPMVMPFVVDSLLSQYTSLPRQWQEHPVSRVAKLLLAKF